ncbi:MAG: protein kinase, partial [Sandaracinaceae bacterium]|nr:protein kinase [Sandaracinaceae bacterium]
MANEDQISLSDDPEVETLVPIKGRDRKFGRYDLGYEIASGGMASVFLARARGPGGFDRLVAIKKIHPHLAKQREFVEMFLDEARLAARINHPNVCSVFDFGEVDGSYYMAMEYLVGQPLSAVLRAAYHRPDLACTRQWQVLAARIIADACEGLHSAHELSDDRGRPLSVVHRDVTPQNLFVTYDGAVKVVDFGVAWAHGRMHETRTGVVKGKFAYMAPEQLQSRPIDRRLDVWALGVCLWELLALKRLFGRRSDAELVLAVVGDTIEPPSSVQPTVPAALDAIVMRALQRDPDARYPTARAMSRELNAFIHASGTPAGLPELADLMRDLVPSERTRKLGVVSTLLDAPPPPSGESPISDSPGTDSPSHSGARPVPHDALTTTRFQGVPKPGPVAPPDLHERT